MGDSPAAEDAAHHRFDSRELETTAGGIKVSTGSTVCSVTVEGPSRSTPSEFADDFIQDTAERHPVSLGEPPEPASDKSTLDGCNEGFEDKWPY
jgi:hypothetical protein